MSEEYQENIRLYDHVSNSGIVHLPGQRFPAVAIQGDSLSNMLSSALHFLKKAKEYNDDELYYTALDMAESLQEHLVQYEHVLSKEGFEKPYCMDLSDIDLKHDF